VKTAILAAIAAPEDLEPRSAGMARWSGEDDPTTKRGILAQEEEHADELAVLLQQYLFSRTGVIPGANRCPAATARLIRTASPVRNPR
jgi:hypothetical protein